MTTPQQKDRDRNIGASPYFQNYTERTEQEVLVRSELSLRENVKGPSGPSAQAWKREVAHDLQQLHHHMTDTLSEYPLKSARIARHELKNINGTNTTEPVFLVQLTPKRNSNSIDGARPDHHWPYAVSLVSPACGHHVRESDNCGW